MLEGELKQVGYIVSAMLFIIAICDLKKERTIAAPIAFFCLEWGGISFLASLKLFSFFEASARTWLIILIGSLSFVAGSMFGRRIKFDSGLVLQDKPFNYNHRRRLYFFYALLLLFFVIKTPELIECVSLLCKGTPLSLIRAARYNQTELDGYTSLRGVRHYLVHVFAPTIDLFAVALGILIYLLDIRKQKRVIFLLIVNEAIKVLLGGGRFDLAHFVIELVICFELIRKRKLFSPLFLQRSKKIVIGLVVAACVAIVYVTTARSIDINEIFEHLYIYICGDVVLLDQKLKIFETTNIWARGLAGGFGFWSLFFTFTRVVLGISDPQLWVDVYKNIMTGQDVLQIGQDVYMNAFVTPYYYLYADFRLFGVVFGMLVFGILSGLLYRRAIQHPNIINIVPYLLISQMIFKTLHTYPLVSQHYMLTFVVFLIMGLRIKPLRLKTM